MNFRPGELTAPDAARLNEMFRELERWKRLSVAYPLALTRGAGSVAISATSLQKAVTDLGAEIAAGALPDFSCSWVGGLNPTDCLVITVVSVAGDCSDVDDSQTVHLEHDTGEVWESTSNFAHDGGSGAVIFTRTAPTPTLTISGADGYALGCDGTGGLLYAFGGTVLCDGTPVTCDNSFVVRVACSCCPIASWAGADKWYCVREAGTEDDCEPQLLTDADKCDDTIEICSGPYDTEAEALAVCPAVVVLPGGSCAGEITIDVPYEYAFTSDGSSFYGSFGLATSPGTTYRFTLISYTGPGIGVNVKGLGYVSCPPGTPSGGFAETGWVSPIDWAATVACICLQVKGSAGATTIRFKVEVVP